jgi:isopentenyldiphosphate isomerase
LESRFDAIVKRGFSQRRKMMMKLLKSDWPPERLERAWREIPLSRQVRAEEVRLDQFVKLTRILAESDSMSPAFEIFDVVNEWDEVIGCETRANVHRLGLRHRAVHVLVFNRRGQLFLQKRSMEKDCFPGAWDSSAAGHLDRGETYDACAVRELREELGVEAVTAPVRLFKIDACPETGHEFTWVYRCEIEGPFKLQPDEIEEGGWFDSSEISAWIADRPGDFASALLVIWEKIRNGPHSVF